MVAKRVYYDDQNAVYPTVWALPRLPTSRFCMFTLPYESFTPMPVRVPFTMPVVWQINRIVVFKDTICKAMRPDNAYARDCKYRASRFAHHEKNDDIIKERNGKGVFKRLIDESTAALGVGDIKFILPTVFF